MATILEELVTKISFRADPKGLEKYKSELKATKREAAGLQSHLNNLRRAALEAFGLRALSNGVQRLLAGIVGTNAEFQTLRARLETATGSAAKANAEFARILKFAAATPFEVKNLVDAFITLKNVGIEPTNDVLTAFGDIAASGGEDITFMANAMRGAVTGEFEMLKRLGIVVRTQGDELAVRFKGVTTRIKNDGKEIVDFVSRELGPQFAGGMERISKTLDGAWSNLQDAAAMAAQQIGEGGLNDALEDATRSVTDLLSESEDLTAIIGTNLGDVVRMLVELLKEIVAQMKNADPEEFRDNLRALKTVMLAFVEVSRAVVKIFTSLVELMGGPKGLIALLIAGRSALLAWNLVMAATKVESVKAATALRGVGVAVAGISAGLTGAALLVGHFERKIQELRDSSRQLAEETRSYIERNVGSLSGAAAQQQVERIDARIAERQRALDRHRESRGVFDKSTDVILGDPIETGILETINELKKDREIYEERVREVDTAAGEAMRQRNAQRDRGLAVISMRRELAETRKRLKNAKTRGEQKSLRKRINELEENLGREQTDFSSKVKPSKQELTGPEQRIQSRLDELQDQAEQRALYNSTGTLKERQAAAVAAGKRRRQQLEQMIAGGDLSVLGGEFSKENQMLRDLGIIDDASKASPPVMTVTIVRVDAPVSAKIEIPVAGTDASPQDIGGAAEKALRTVEDSLRQAIEDHMPRTIR